ncbi:uncharacterized protein PFLUO_LOCUS1550 [Penicillium psychrofluorescens]|uniref:uncharacterized protein n=1 Tax=Penicillium psychrofluorescens TaxID=3158075 RepID=UPI003CCCC0D7
MSSTCYTLSRVPAVQSVWHEHAPRIGFSTPFVLHALLAISALHLGRCEPHRRAACFTRAQWHHDIAIRSVVPAVPALASENSVALFLFSSLTCIFSCACNHDEESFLTLFEGGRLCDWVRLFRGTKTIIDSSSEDFRTGKLAPIFLNGSYSAAVRRGSQAMDLGQMYVWELKKMISKECSHNDQILRTYQETLDNVGRTLGVVLKLGEGRGLETADVFAWLLEVSDDYLDLLRTWDPVALIIFSYFCVALRQIEWMWWMEGLSGRLMKQITSVLDKKYCSWLRWPQEQIGWETLGSR